MIDPPPYYFHWGARICPPPINSPSCMRILCENNILHDYTRLKIYTASGDRKFPKTHTRSRLTNFVLAKCCIHNQLIVNCSQSSPSTYLARLREKTLI